MAQAPVPPVPVPIPVPAPIQAKIPDVALMTPPDGGPHPFDVSDTDSVATVTTTFGPELRPPSYILNPAMHNGVAGEFAVSFSQEKNTRSKSVFLFTVCEGPNCMASRPQVTGP